MLTSRRLTRFCALLLLTLVALPFTAPFQTFDAANRSTGSEVLLTLIPADADDGGASIVPSGSGERTRLMIVPHFTGPSRSLMVHSVVPPVLAPESRLLASLQTVLRV